MVVSNICYFHPYLGKIPILIDIFQRVETTNQFSFAFFLAAQGLLGKLKGNDLVSTPPN